MTVTIALPPDDEKKLALLAAASGTDTAEYVRRIIKKEIDAPLSIAQAAEPFARAVEKSGVNDDEFASILNQARTEARETRRTQGRGQRPA
jgi:predicted DNA-binding protein